MQELKVNVRSCGSNLDVCNETTHKNEENFADCLTCMDGLKFAFRRFENVRTSREITVYFFLIFELF